MINPKKKKEITSSSNKLIIRESLPADAENIYSFLIDVIPETYSYISGGDLFRGELLNNDEYRNYARETYQNNDINRCVVLTDDDSIWGIIALKRLPNLEFEVHSLYVHQSQRGKGYGSLLLENLESQIPMTSKMVIDVVDGNAKAIMFWESRGYQAVAGYTFPFRWNEWPSGVSVSMQRFEKQNISHIERQWNTGYAVIDSEGIVVRSKNPGLVYETSSTIKTPLMRAFMRQMSAEGSRLDREFTIEERHKSNGSGIASWTDWKSLPLHAIIDLTCVYSDCLTTNIMIEYLGGMTSVNTQFRKLGYKSTKILKDHVSFDDTCGGIEHFGSTTPLEAAKWMPDVLTDTDIDPQILSQFIHSTRSIDTPWFTHPDPTSINLLVKTGSMIDTDDQGSSVYNLVGSFTVSGKQYSFAFFSYGTPGKPTTTADEATAKTILSDFIHSNLLNM